MQVKEKWRSLTPEERHLYWWKAVKLNGVGPVEWGTRWEELPPLTRMCLRNIQGE